MDAVALELRTVGFVPRERAGVADDDKTLFAAVRRAHGMRPDDADVCYWNWKGLRANLSSIWAVLDQEATVRNGKTIQAHVWTFSKDRTIDEVLSLIEAADTQLEACEVMTAARRPEPVSMIAADRPRGALMSTMGVLHVALAAPMTEVLAQVLTRVPLGATNESSLGVLDEFARELDAIPGSSDKSLIPRVMSRYFGSRPVTDGGMDHGWSFREFLVHLTEVTAPSAPDDGLLVRLRELSPEPTKSAKVGSMELAD